MSLAIIAAGSLFGMWLNRNGKQSRLPSKKTVVAANDIPSGPLIYSSERTKQVDSYVRGLANIKHAQAIKQRFPTDYAAPQTVFPDDSLYDVGAPLIELNAQQQKKQVGGNPLPNMTAYDPQSGKPIVKKPTVIANAPMFREFKGARMAPINGRIDPNISLLSDQPTNFAHANMNPTGNFGSMAPSEALSQVRLEQFTGVPSSLDQGTYRDKQEVARPPPNNPQSLKTANVYQVSDLFDRAGDTVKPSYDYMSPVKPFKDLPMSTDIQVMPLVNTQGVNSKVKTYTLPTVAGQRSSMVQRGALPNPAYNAPSLFHETSTQNFMPNRSFQTGSVVSSIPTVRDTLSTQVTQNTYIGAPVASKKDMSNQQILDANIATLNSTVSSKLPVYQPEFGAPTAPIKGHIDTGVLMVKEPRMKDNVQDYVSAPYLPNGWLPRDNVESPDTTLKETFTDATVPSNPQPHTMNNAYLKQNVDLQMTNRATMTDNTWTGAPRQDLGMGNRNQKYELPTTVKETTQFEQVGNPRSEIPAHMSYDAVFDLGMDQSVRTNHVNAGAAPVRREADRNAEMDEGYREDLLVTDYFPNPTGPTTQRNQVDRSNIELEPIEKLDNSDYIRMPKRFNGDYAGRDTEVALRTEDDLVKGRVNVGLARDGEVRQMDVGVTLKEEMETVDNSRMMRTQPNLSGDPIGVGIQIRTKNVEALNPRLDPGVKLTNDLFPFVK